MKKGFDKVLKKYASCNWGFAEDCLEVYENLADHLSNDLILLEISILIFSTANKQKLIINSCRNNLWFKPILILLKTRFKILRKEPGDEAFRILFKFQGADEISVLADFNRFSNIETRSRYSYLVL